MWEDLEKVVVVDFRTELRTERRLLVENLLVLKLLAFWLGLDVLSRLGLLEVPADKVFYFSNLAL